MIRLHRRALNCLLLACIAMLFAGCAAQRLHDEGLDLLQQGKAEEGLRKLELAAAAEPGNLQFRSDALARKYDAVKRLLSMAASQSAAGKRDEAEASYRQVLRIDTGNERARAGLDALERSRRAEARVNEAEEAYRKGDLEKAHAMALSVLSADPDNVAAAALKRVVEERVAAEKMAQPALRSVYAKPISMEFRDTPLRMVFDFLSRTTGINFILDRDIRPELRTTISVSQAPLEEAVDVLLTTNLLAKRILGQSSVLIYPRSPEKVKEFQDLMVKSFYLANADPKRVQNTIKTLLKSRELVVDEQLNLLIMRDTPDAIRLAERLIALQDLVEPEVMLDVEVLEIKRTRLMELGIRYPDQVSLTPLSATGGTSLTVEDLRNLNASRIGVGIASTLVNFKKEDGDVNLLANPRIRARNREKAKIMIGDKVPVITTTATSTGFVSESVQYLDVGLKLEVEPNVYLRDDVGIKINLEVSSIAQAIRSASGSLTYQIGTRTASTSLRLKDGETQILAGLISDEDRRTANKIPGLGDLPVLGRLFSSHLSDAQKTEIVLSITPRLVRNIERPGVVVEEFWSGSENSPTGKIITLAASIAAGGAGGQGNPTQTTASGGAPSLAPATNVALSWDGPTSVKTGEAFQVALRVKSEVALQGLPIRIDFDPATLQVEEVSEGEFFKKSDGVTAFAKDVDNAAGRVLISLSRTGGGSIKGDDKALTLTLRAKAGKEGAVRIGSALPVSPTQTQAVVSLPAPYSVAIGN